MMMASGTRSSRRGGALRVAAMAVMTVAIALSHISLEAEARYRGINQFCTHSFWRNMCTLQVNNATAYEDAVKNCLEAAIAFNGVVQRALPQVLSLFNEIPLVSKDSAVATCTENFNNIGENLQEALKYVAQNDTGSISSYLSACKLNDCDDALKAVGVEYPPQVERLLRLQHHKIDNCFAVLLQN